MYKTRSAVSHAGPARPPAPSRLPTPLVLLMASGAGLSVASIYYSQPMLGLLGPVFGADAATIGLVPTLTQIGYALGILFLAPLGDRYDRRRIILVKAALLALTLLACGLAPDLGWMLGGSLLLGITATMAQDIVPAAATLAPEARRGRVVGTVMTGLLLGILLSRVASGVVAAEFGWRVVYGAACVGMLAILAGIWFWMPRFHPTTRLGYGRLLASMGRLWLRHGALRRAAFAQGTLSMAFSAFWATLAIMLLDRYGMGPAQAGAFGLAGAAGALAAPLSGRLADRYGPELSARLGAGVAAVSFATLALAPLLSPSGQIVLLAGATVGFDFGVQAALVAHQTIVYAIEPGARSRLNALLFTGIFVGMALGAAFGSAMLARWGWPGVVAFATGAATLALIARLVPRIGRA